MTHLKSPMATILTLEGPHPARTERASCPSSPIRPINVHPEPDLSDPLEHITAITRLHRFWEIALPYSSCQLSSPEPGVFRGHPCCGNNLLSRQSIQAQNPKNQHSIGAISLLPGSSEHGSGLPSAGLLATKRPKAGAVSPQRSEAPALSPATLGSGIKWTNREDANNR